MDKTVLIFGAGINQYTLIEAARKLGVKSVVIDPCADPPGKQISDVFYQVGAQDYELTKLIAQKEKVDGIVTSQMENPLRLMAKLADDMGFIFHTSEIIEHCRNKFLMKQVFYDHSVPCAKGILVKTDHEITENELSKQGLFFPLIVKPTDAFSSKGVLKVNDMNELHPAIASAASISSDGGVLIEEFMKGPEYSIETITYEGVTTIVQFTEKIITPYPRTVEMGHIQPANLSNELKTELGDLVKKAIKALQIDNSGGHLEAILCKDGFKIVEAGARLGGDFISSYLTKVSTGISMDEAAILVSLGIKPELEQLHNEYSYIKYFELITGKKIREIEDISDIKQMSEVVLAQIFLSKGDTVLPVKNSAFRPACILVKGSSREEVISKADHLEKKMISRIIYQD
jgi:biotin carboxylase